MIGHHRRMQPRPRVLTVAQSAGRGGAERALERLAKRLQGLGFDVELVDPGTLPVGGIEEGAWARALLSWPRARAQARDADVVLLNGIVAQRLAPAMTSATLV